MAVMMVVIRSKDPKPEKFQLTGLWRAMDINKLKKFFTLYTYGCKMNDTGEELVNSGMVLNTEEELFLEAYSKLLYALRTERR